MTAFFYRASSANVPSGTTNQHVLQVSTEIKPALQTYWV